MSEHRLAVDVSGSPYAGDVGFQLVVGDYSSALGQDSDILKSDSGGVSAAADRAKYAVAGNLERLSVKLAGYRRAADSGDLRAEHELDSALLVVLLQYLGDCRLGGSADVVEHFDDCDLDADRIEVGRHLKSDYAAADHYDMTRQCRHVEYLAVGFDKSDHKPLTQSGNRRYRRRRAGADEQLRAGIFVTADLDREAVRAAPRNLGVTVDDLDSGVL